MATRYQYTTDQQYLHQLTAGAWLPLVKSGLSGGIAFVVVLVIGLASRWRDPLTWAGVIGVTTWGLAWLSLWRHWFHLTGAPDMPADPTDSNSSPLSRKHSIRVVVQEVTSDGHLRSGQYLDFPCTAEQLAELARGLVENDQPFTERAWCGAGRPFSVIAFRELRNEFISRGLVSLASSKDVRQGYILSLAGRHVLAGVLEELSKN